VTYPSEGTDDSSAFNRRMVGALAGAAFWLSGCGWPPPLRLESAPATPVAIASELVLNSPTLGHSRGYADAESLSLSVTGLGEGSMESVPTGEPETARTSTIVAQGARPVVTARTDPDESAAVIQQFSHPTPRGGPLVFKALGEPVGGWIEVQLPIRPNGSTGWLRVADVTLSRNPYRIDLAVSDYQLTVFRHDEPVLTTTVAIGTGDTPTPIGDFYLIELLQTPDPSGLYGPFAYGLSSFSDTLDSFNGGPGIIGIHGTNQPELLGSNVSHGCVRVDNAIISEMATFLPLGTPVSIHQHDRIGWVTSG